VGRAPRPGRGTDPSHSVGSAAPSRDSIGDKLRGHPVGRHRVFPPSTRV
jgi:hypothetical protein